MGNTRRSTRASPQLSPRRRMTPTSLLNSSQQPHQHDERSKSHDQLDDLHDGEEVSTPSDCPPGLSTNTVLNPPIWERLVCSPPATCERISLITTIFSSRDEVGMVRRLRGGDAQACIDMMYEARSCIFSSLKSGFTDFDSNLRVLLIRCWMTSIMHHG